MISVLLFIAYLLAQQCLTWICLYYNSRPIKFSFCINCQL